MFSVQKLSFNSSGTLNKLVYDYLNRTENTNQLYDQYPDEKGFEHIIKHNSFQQLNRSLLVETALEQSKLVTNTGEITLNNIELLKHNNTYTITTGHQLCLFTGPLYFIYKILSCIQLCEELHKKFPDQNFVPVYWMASEDHDFDEVNHFYLFGKKIEWQTEQKGAVGLFNTQSLQTVFNDLKTSLGDSQHATYLLSLFEEAYLQHSQLSDATRYLVNELFNEWGLVCIDGNDSRLKSQCQDIFKKDIFENLAYECIQPSIHYLENNHYHTQVNPREINCFYLDPNTRVRIEKNNQTFQLVGTDRTFSSEELTTIIKNNSEKLSPNVVLRPLYQQHILPNIAYVGGPGELAYWLEYKNMFDQFKIQFPILVPRNFISIIDAAQHQKIEKLQLPIEQFFKSEKELVDAFQIQQKAVYDLTAHKTAVSTIFGQVESELSNIDKSLLGSVQAELQKSINGLAALEAKANKALKQKSETEINQLKNIKSKLFPQNIPQERHDNIMNYILKFGPSFINNIKQHINTLDFNHKVFIES